MTPIPDRDGAPECQCPTCGRLHRSLQAGTPPVSVAADARAREAAEEIEKLVATLCKPWTAFYGHADEFAAIIAQHFPNHPGGDEIEHVASAIDPRLGAYNPSEGFMPHYQDCIAAADLIRALAAHRRPGVAGGGVELSVTPGKLATKIMAALDLAIGEADADDKDVLRKRVKLLIERRVTSPKPAPSVDEVCRVADRVSSLFAAIKHGDEQHRAWLKKAIEDHFAGRKVERP